MKKLQNLIVNSEKALRQEELLGLKGGGGWIYQCCCVTPPHNCFTMSVDDWRDGQWIIIQKCGNGMADCTYLGGGY